MSDRGRSAGSRGASPSARGRRSRAATCPLPNDCATSAGTAAPVGVLNLARARRRPGLISPDRLSVWNVDIAGQPLVSSSSVFRTRTHGCSQPSRVSTRRYSPLGVVGRARPVQIDRQQLADRRSSYLPSANESGPPSISSPPPRWLTKIPQQGQLVRREEGGLEVVDDDRVILVYSSSAALGKPSLSSTSSCVPSRTRTGWSCRSAVSGSG